MAAEQPTNAAKEEVNPPSPASADAGDNEEGTGIMTKSGGTFPVALFLSPDSTVDILSTAKKEAKRLEKLAKLAARNIVAPVANAAKKEKKEKAAKEELPPAEEWVNPTPPGQKKGEFCFSVDE